MRAVDIIKKKRFGGELNESELAAFVRAATDGSWPDYQLSALLMAVCFQGMTPAETADYTRLMTRSGKVLDLSDIPGVKVDKHSTGGVGDKISLILAPLAAACGAVVPMMSGRGLGHTGGTLDKLESIPGFRVNLSEAEFRTALRKVGIGMIGQTAEVAPSDKKLYALRDVTGTVECVPLITGSILSKKLAEGISALVMDVKCGKGAFMKNFQDAKTLAELIVRVGTLNGLKVEAIITSMEAPLGRAVGNTLEVIESIETLQGKGPKDIEELSIVLTAAMVRLAGMAPTDEAAAELVRRALASGAALEKFRQMVAAQGGDPRIVENFALLPTAPDRATVVADADGFIGGMDAEAVGVAAMHLGAGREKSEDTVDHAVGVMVRRKPGDAVAKGDVVFELHHRGGKGVHAAEWLLKAAFDIVPAAPELDPLVLDVVV
jgi:pyrimidine-nucleoside phosphorylase